MAAFRPGLPRLRMIIPPASLLLRPTPDPNSAAPSSMKPIRKAIFPVAGLGTRFLPATKAMPKEMLPVVDRPLIQHVVDEARQAGIEHFIFVTGRNKSVIEDHFDRQFELELTLTERKRNGRTRAAVARPAGRRADELHPPAIAARPRPCGVVRARARRPRAVRAAAARRAGAGRARLPRPDDRRLPAAAGEGQRHRGRGSAAWTASTCTASSASATPAARPSRSPAWWRSRRAAKRPSNLIITGRYILQPEIFDILGDQTRGAGGEIQLTDAMIRLAADAAVLRAEIPGPQLRLRQQDRLPRRQRRLCAGARGHRAGIPRRAQGAAGGVTPRSVILGHREAVNPESSAALPIAPRGDRFGFALARAPE